MVKILGANLQAADQVALLRTLGLLLQIGLTLFAADTFGLSLQMEPLMHVFVLEVLYLSLTLALRKPLFAKERGLFIALSLDTLFWISWLYFSGGATNAFISLLLLPIALAAVTLPIWAPWSLTAISTLAYSLMIFTVPESQMQHHGMDMSSHYLGMWFNFVISALVLTTSVALIAKRMRRQDAQLAYMREGQLRQEQLVALGTVSAQMAHQLATPLSTLHLLLDELREETPEPSITLVEMETALGRCEHTLAELRLATESIRDRRQRPQNITELVAGLKQKTQLLMPQTELNWLITCEPKLLEEKQILTDMSLTPAIMALIENAARASVETIGTSQVDISVDCSPSEGRAYLQIRDYGAGIAPSLLPQLGTLLIESPNGLGVALLLSHASLERLGAELILANHPQGGTVAQIRFTLLHPNASATTSEAL
ncbi:ATP-binding protein [Shewanella xiamenensis]|uniref:sensor histidine kinase n=1 Tax=Shewanella xiamenensis TaxID=332186 RepID=UPI001C4DECE3|nr:HAMP domain-containing sensor histidine kinase [Shewanella xiamenensis]MBW0279999.1 histidine kinase [Shewanella xiamenensis]MBW0296660.1 histidine kinase [Shewanella xiamenensis]MCT8873236.1 sensor histidine kinase [Shewanella xiamenensis]MDH1315481.1 ATP-binding protein [Shewanella xiamenensis]UWH43920.1 sensor histidine kinase [Shewanella xiamenensis]